MGINNSAELRSWVRQAGWAGEEAKWMGLQELIRTHRELHDRFGDNPNDLVLDIEVTLSSELRKQGIEHRYTDQLSQNAGTVVSEPKAATLTEVQAYLDAVGLDSDAIALVRGTDGGPVLVDMRSPLLKGKEKGILKAMNRLMPPGLPLKLLSKGIKGDFAEVLSAYQLQLTPAAVYQTIQITTWETLTARLRVSAAAASNVFKESEDPRISLRILKEKATETSSEDEQVVVTAVVLEPETVDGSKTAESEGDIYSEEEIYKGMEWWMENSKQAFSYLHASKGGRPLAEDEVVLLENWQARVDQKIGTQDIKKGSWLTTVKVHQVDLVKDIRQGRINSFSIGLSAMAALERVAA